MSFLKNLFIVSEETPNNEASKPTVTKQATATKFTNPVAPEPSSSPSFTFQKTETTSSNFTPTPAPIEVSQEYFEKLLEMYEEKFGSLNLNGFDFYEFYQSVSHGDLNNPATYNMAFAMASGMDKSITKEKLVEQADFYISEITKVYNDNVTNGNNKRLSLTDQKETENKTLSSELISFQQQVEALKIQITDRENKLRAIDSKYQPQLSEIDGKLGANEIAKNKIVESIQIVKQGINTNIK
jgi:hypothetical protein